MARGTGQDCAVAAPTRGRQLRADQRYCHLIVHVLDKYGNVVQRLRRRDLMEKALLSEVALHIADVVRGTDDHLRYKAIGLGPDGPRVAFEDVLAFHPRTPWLVQALHDIGFEDE